VEGGRDEEKNRERQGRRTRRGTCEEAEGIGQLQLQDPGELGSRYQNRLPSA
jgi:hypothetical protein